MPYITQVAVGKLKELGVFGNDYDTPDGTGVRDYIHVCDLASGHVAAIKKLEEKSGLSIYNLGTGIGYSVLDISKRPPGFIFPTRSSPVVPVILPPATPLRKRPKESWAGRPGTESGRCALIHGTGRSPIRTATKIDKFSNKKTCIERAAHVSFHCCLSCDNNESGSLVKRLRRRPLSAKTAVRFR